jgi:hypothetical protein
MLSYVYVRSDKLIRNQNLLIPALVSLLIYLILSYVIVPLWQRYRGRYSRYVPLEAISTHTSSARQRVQGLLVGFLVPSRWRSDYQSSRFAVSAQEGSDSAFDGEDGEELFEITDGRREALSLDERRGHDENGSRLSRDLEEGFRDDSDNDETTVNPIGTTR